MGITSPYPRKNIIAGNYILADTQAHQSKHHRQQNNEIRDKTFTMKRWVFFHFQLNQERLLHRFWVSGLSEKNKKFYQTAVFIPLSVSIYVSTFFAGKNKKFPSGGCIYALHLLNICKDIF